MKKGRHVNKILLSTHRLTDRIDKWLATKGKHMSATEREVKWKHIQATQLETFHLLEPQRLNDGDAAHCECDECTGCAECTELVQCLDCCCTDSLHEGLALLVAAMNNLKAHGQRPIIGIYDDVVRVRSDLLIYRKGYGSNQFWGMSPMSDFTPEQWSPSRDQIFGLIMAAATKTESPVAALEFDLAVALASTRCNLDVLLSFAVMRGGVLLPGVDVCIKTGLDSVIRFYRVKNDEKGPGHLVYAYKGTTIPAHAMGGPVIDDAEFTPIVTGYSGAEPRFDYGSGSCSVYARYMLGEFSRPISSEGVHEIHIEGCATEAHLIRRICAMGRGKLEKLTLIDVHLFGGYESEVFFDGHGSGWPYLTIVREMLRNSCQALHTLVLENVVLHRKSDVAGRSILVGKRVEFHGIDEVLYGLVGLISSLTVLDEEQRHRYARGEVDSDGKEL
jgi:hypothetical protein